VPSTPTTGSQPAPAQFSHAPTPATPHAPWRPSPGGDILRSAAPADRAETATSTRHFGVLVPGPPDTGLVPVRRAVPVSGLAIPKIVPVAGRRPGAGPIGTAALGVVRIREGGSSRTAVPVPAIVAIRCVVPVPPFPAAVVVRMLLIQQVSRLVRLPLGG
jgi:hypothetical protein